MATAQYTPESRTAGSPNKSEAWREVVHILAQAAAMHAVHLQSSDVEPLQKNFLHALEALKGEPGDEAIRTSGKVLASDLEAYNRATQAAVNAALAGLKETIAALSAGLRTMAQESGLSAQIDALQAIISSARTPEELEVGRAQIEDLVRDVSLKEKERSARLGDFVNELQQRIDDLERAPEAPVTGAAIAAQAATAQLDGLTGIPNGAAAREAILHSQSSDTLPHLAVIHIQSLDLLNARFGQRIGDQIVLTCCQHLASNLCRGNDRIFRWRGPAFVALLERDDSPAGVAREISHVCNSISTSFFGEPHRSILIPVKMASTTLPISGRLITEVFDSVERFIVRAGRTAG